MQKYPKISDIIKIHKKNKSVGWISALFARNPPR